MKTSTTLAGALPLAFIAIYAFVPGMTAGALLPYAAALGVALVAMYLTTFTACAAISGLRRTLEDAPDTQRKIDELVVEGKDKVREIPADEARRLIEELHGVIRDNRKDIHQFIGGLGRAGQKVQQVSNWLDKFKSILDQFENNLEMLVKICLYLFYKLVEEVGELLAELVAYLLFLMFRERLRRVIDEMIRQFWWFRFLANVLR